ncbi:PD-(D/E)XK motif protein [Salibacterium qingdaonense]|uniref:Putative PD-(D/E)XK family member n=1 Tax=Salibacterium qingdaonense TaxID=266892 RepID=A0A1I4LJH3_9BACI|nr:PD-(D/E)XK motif protein [Salibacterium qingdaonense]SFL91051.1 Putative PD-(D/E)XK family member [Salibacterium qingdaonense]
MNLVQEIKDKFANLQKSKAYKLQGYDAWVFMFEDGTYGTAVPYDGSKVNEQFANVKFYSTNAVFGEDEQNFLILASTLLHLRNEFALFCADFADPGENHQNRREIQEEPLEWWKKWRELLGNAVKHKQVHSILGEMYVVQYLLKQQKNVKWKPTDYATYDVESGNQAFEVKSTTSKYQDTLTISSQFQLRDPDFLVMCRFEKSNTGASLEDMVAELAALGLDRSFLNVELDAVGFPEGSEARGEKYKLLDMRQYPVDEDFPGKELSDFLQNLNDPNVGKVSYDIDLKGCSYENLLKDS